jgi:4-aminobutyrate aminotransferase
MHFLATEGDVNQSSARRQWQARNLSEATLEVLSEDEDAFIKQSLSTPCLNAIAKAHGSWIEDIEGRRYLDFHGNSVHQVGYGHPAVIRAAKDQLDQLPFSPRRYTNVPAIALAKRLGDLAPDGLTKVLFAPGGASAMGIALKLARVATGKFKTVSMWDSFHGASLDTISIGGEAQFRSRIGPLLPGTSHVPPPDPRRCPLRCGGTCSLACADYLSYVLDHEGDVGAVIAEPVRCTTAARPSQDYWRQVREACDRHGALLIFDEIPTCLGRTGHMFASELTGVAPDIIVVGKGLGGGVFPLAAVLARSNLDIAGDISLGHFTHEKSPVGAAIGLATLDVIENEGLVERSRNLGSWLVKQLQGLIPHHTSIEEARGVGLLVAVEMSTATIAEQTMYYALDHGLNFKVSSSTVLTLTPPLTISEDELSLAITALDASIGLAEKTQTT